MEEVDGVKFIVSAGDRGLHKEKEIISEEVEVKKAKNVKTYPCKEPWCGKKFERVGHLNQHIVTVHLKESLYQCKEPGCDEKFGIQIHLN